MEVSSFTCISVMANSYFKFKKFTVFQDKTAMKVTTDACLFGAWCAAEISKEHSEDKKALDIGTGTGLLSLMVAQKTKLHIDAVEIEDAAAQQCGENINIAAFEYAIKIHHNDIKIFEPGEYDYIISNPPFYEHDLKSGTPLKNTAHHSSQLTLEQVVKIISDKINPSGKFYLLLSFNRKNDIIPLLQKQNLCINKIVEVSQTENHKPFRIMISGSNIPGEVESTSIQIKNKDDYSTAFKKLLTDYYLYL